MNATSTRIRLSVAVDAALLAMVPLGLNILRLLDPNGSKIFGIALLLLLLFKNLLLMPGVSGAHQKRIYSESISRRLDPRIMLPLVLMLILISIAVWRALGFFYTFSNVFSNVALLVFGLIGAATAYLNADNDEERWLLLKAAPIGIFLLVVANIVGFAVGFRSAPVLGEERLNQTLSLVGVTAGRVLFPLTVGTNAFGSVCALGVISSFLLWDRRSVAACLFAVLTAGVCFLALVAVDSRAAMAAIVAAGFWLFLVRRVSVLRYLPLGLVVIGPFVPFLLAALFRAINDNGLLSGLVRAGSQGAKLGVGTGRQFIWTAAQQQIANAEPLHLIGFGAYGPAQSKFSASYAWIFNELGQTATSVHNTMLQNFFDMGYVGVAVWVWCLFAVVSRALKLSKLSRDRGFLSVVVATLGFLLLQMQTEVVVTIYGAEIIFFFVVLAVSISAFASAKLRPGE
ncbi:hypothetical protein J2X16_001052 [Pelomonas aquatica]|uniref:O-antigen ligase-related domain-containing protein n=1 Tax=Pelomonas aquatica TaxID=431058 RepID=A0ABU1Z7N5_9BURK|nr:O-antigen ligase family protein [Pelomonas aquatica]MDR7295731.1 hypothetical protein [Pelomonas aquatica]